MPAVVHLAEALAATGSPAEGEAVQRAYRAMLRAIKVDVSRDDRRAMRRAYELAVWAHRRQRRKSGEPYVLHPIAVATICAREVGLGPTAIVAALLHDVVEDTDVTLAEIEGLFGRRVRRLVDGLTKLDASVNDPSPDSPAESLQAENFRKVVTTLLEDVRVVLIKMADRMHNMRTLGSMPAVKQAKIAAETAYVYAPLAHRLGLYAFKTEFQDLCLKIQAPDTYREIARKLDETKRERQRYIADFLRPLRELLDASGLDYRIFGRPKSIFSIYEKIRNKEVRFEEIYDLFAVRVVLDVPYADEKAACWQVYSLITDVYKPIAERLKDWITNPKANGYESLHTTLIGPKGRYVECQIRTERMDAIAERGFAAHWKYKGVAGQPDSYEPWLDSVRELLEHSTAGGASEQSATQFLADFKTGLFSEELFVYTPKGEMVSLPKGATALDFAFSVHSMVGYHCQAVKVNNRLVPMGHELAVGDRVEVITNKHQRPSEAWLEMVVTGKARAKIRSALKEERRRVGELGREELQRKLAHRKVRFDDGVEAILKHLRIPSRVDLFYALATGELTTEQIFRQLEVDAGRLSPKPTPDDATAGGEGHRATRAPGAAEQAAPRKVKRPRHRTAAEPELLVNGEPARHYDYQLASCCSPVQGDQIFGYLSGTNSLKIHRTNCTNATHLLSNYAYRVMKAEWGVPVAREFVADLLIKGIDTGRGVLTAITTELTQRLDLDIRAMHIEGDGGYFECRLAIVVKNADQLAVAMRSLGALEAVTSVAREGAG